MTTTTERIEKMTEIFAQLMSTDSRNEKNDIVNAIPEELKDDFNLCIKVLTGQLKVGYTAYPVYGTQCKLDETLTISDLYDIMLQPLKQGNLTESNIAMTMCKLGEHGKFMSMLANREYKLGIGLSVLHDDNKINPMLAKKYTGSVPLGTIYTVTEKLDGNRCIARYNEQTQKWEFMSRSGKAMYVNFDMRGLPTHYIYDGEVLSHEQTILSNEIYEAVLSGVGNKKVGSSTDMFNRTSGLINRHNYNKDLVYNIFDIVNTNDRYANRRLVLNQLSLGILSESVRVLPQLCSFIAKETSNDTLFKMLDIVTGMGGEGLMLNNDMAQYTQKRTDSLLKFKKVQSMDLLVEDIYDGRGKYSGLVGGLYCTTHYNGQLLTCNVGTGLSDAQRIDWTANPGHILGKVVEVEYFSVCSNKNVCDIGRYSLRFPRLKRIRDDKTSTSPY